MMSTNTGVLSGRVEVVTRNSVLEFAVVVDDHLNMMLTPSGVTAE